VSKKGKKYNILKDGVEGGEVKGGGGLHSINCKKHRVIIGKHLTAVEMTEYTQRPLVEVDCQRC